MSKRLALLDEFQLEQFDDALEDLEIHGLHSNPGYRKLKKLYIELIAQDEPPTPPVSVDLGTWLSAALEDPATCDELKTAIRAWFQAGQPAFHYHPTTVDPSE